MSGPPLPLSRVAEVLQGAGLLVESTGPEDAVVRGVAQDSRRVEPGDLFLAWKGVETDAHDFVADAVSAGAVAAVVERRLEGLEAPQLVVSDGRLAGALAADAVLGSPARGLFLAAVTGTNGKTTSALLARHLLSRRGPAAVVGTLGLVGPDGRVRPGTEALTTPGPVTLARWMRGLADEGVESVVMEASSHALAQRRLDALRFEAAAFTNLGRDHLDYHADLSDYFAAKARLVDLLADGGTAVVNREERAWDDLGPAPRTLSFAVEEDADVRARDVELLPSGSRFMLEAEGAAEPTELPFPGRYNVENALAAAGIALVRGLSVAEVAETLPDAPQVPGRLERVTAEPVPVLIDFAHTPDALEGVLSTLAPLTEGRLVVVFGAGGDRDRTKRKPMGEAAARWADEVVLTSDNPRTEDPERILDDLEEGLGSVPHHRVVDRREAIGLALELARPGDVVLLAGKGHETYQVLGEEKVPFDERTVVREALAAGGSG